MTIRQLVRDTLSLEPDDSLGKAAELIRHSSFSVAPVVDKGSIVGLVSERDLSTGLRNSNGGGDSIARVSNVMTPTVEHVGDFDDIEHVADHFDASRWDALPVVDSGGHLCGMVSRSDVVAALCGSIRPPVVGGMATPLGVLLHTGNLRAGASNFALALTGALMQASFSVVHLGTTALVFSLEHYASVNLAAVFQGWASQLNNLATLRLSEGMQSWRLATFAGDGLYIVALAILQMLLFLMIIRLMPLAGYHGAEHKVVHAIEQGEDLTPERVRQMPRPHPRCGTNIAVFMVIVVGLWGRIDSGLALIIGLIGWKILGMWIQQVFTTKEPTEKQLRSAISAGIDLLQRYNQNPSHKAGFSRRLMNMGIPQIIVGMSTVYMIEQFILHSIAKAFIPL